MEPTARLAGLDFSRAPAVSESEETFYANSVTLSKTGGCREVRRRLTNPGRDPAGADLSEPNLLTLSAVREEGVCGCCTENRDLEC